MKARHIPNTLRVLILLGILGLFNLTQIVPSAEAMEKWWPSRYGADDELGTLNEITPQKVVEAASVVGNGQVYSLGTEYGRESPGYPPRFWETTCLAHRILNPLGTNKFVWLEEEFTGCPGVGTQFDGLGHVGIEYAPGDIRFYNGRKLSDVLAGNALLKRWGMDQTPQVVTRGIMADMVAYKGRELKAGEAIGTADIEACLKKQEMEVKPGDALLIHTGWMRWYKEDKKKFMSGEPGITVDVIEWANKKRVAMIGTDQWATEVVPMAEKGPLFPVHTTAAKYGMYLVQNLFLDEVAKDKVYESMFVFTHPRIAGSTQGIGNPLVIGNGPDPKNEGPILGPEPEGKRWWPSRYGEKDELGSLNELTSERVSTAAKLVKHGKVFDMGTRYAVENPGFPPRYWHNTTLAHRLQPALGSNKFVWLEEMFSGCPGVGTQTDILAHTAKEYEPGDIRFYNGFKLSEVLSGNALAVKFQQWVPIVTRGVLADMAAFKGRDLEIGEPITPEDLEGCLKEQNVEVNPGDALIINTGWMKWFTEDPKKFMKGHPGITVAAAEWAYKKRLSFIAIDQWSTEVVPMINKKEVWPVHTKAQTELGFTWGQNFVTDDLSKDCAKDKVYDFMFINACPKIPGTTQGISSPIAIK